MLYESSTDPQYSYLFRELRIACTVAQMEREGGISPRLSPLAQVFLNVYVIYIVIMDWLKLDFY